MLTPRVIPCLDVKDGRIVKGVRFSNLRDAGDPATRAAYYEETGADEIVILDVSATLESRKTRLSTVRAVRERLSIPLTVGGGVRTIDDASALLEAGADKVTINSAAVDDPERITHIAERFGTQCCVLALDATRHPRGFYDVVVKSGRERTGKDAILWAQEATRRGAGEILLTSFDKDGTRSGYDLRLIQAIAEVVRVPIIASGGAAGAHHLWEALCAGADAVLAASIFHDDEHTPNAVKKELVAFGAEVRL